MSKLNIQQVLKDTRLSTECSGLMLTLKAPRRGNVEMSFGHYGPAEQYARAEDLRELSQIFLEVAKLLEGSEKAQEKMAEPEEGRREVHVKFSSSAGNSTLHGVFSGLTDKQVEELQHAILVMDGALPQGMHIWALD